MIFLMVWLACAIACAIIAGNKGRSGFGWFFIGLIFGVFGLLIALVVSDLRGEQAALTSQVAEEADSRKCPYCAERIKREAIVCRFCGRDLPAIEASYASDPEFEEWLAAQNPPITHATGEDRASYRQAWLAGRK